MSDIRPVSIFVPIADASTAQTVLVPVTDNLTGQLVQVKTVLGGAISGADDKVIISKNATALGTIVVANSSSAAGDIDTLNINGVYLGTGDYISIANGGESTDAATLGVVIDIKR